MKVWYEATGTGYTGKHYTVNILDEAGHMPTGLTDLNNGWRGFAEKLEKEYKEHIEQQAKDTSFYIKFNKETNNMTRLTTSGDWTILLENEKLVAVNSKGQVIRAVGALLSADGKAWMWKNSKLWSGELTHHKTEQDVRNEEYSKKREREFALTQKREEELKKIYNKYDKKLRAELSYEE